MTPVAMSDAAAQRVNAVAAYVPSTADTLVVLPASEHAAFAPLLQHLGPVRTYDDADDKTVAPDTVVFALPPRLPDSADPAALVTFACESERFATLCAGLDRWVALDATSLADAAPDVLRPLSRDAAEAAQRFLDWVSAAPRIFRQDGGAFPLPQTGWETELGDLSRERMCQAPAGEVFAHFDASQWNGRIMLAHGGMLELSAGRVVRGPAWALHKSVCEVGFGLTPAVQSDHRAWGEEALGSVPLGIGVADDVDLAPPTMHSDVLIDPAKFLNRDLWRCF